MTSSFPTKQQAKCKTSNASKTNRLILKQEILQPISSISKNNDSSIGVENFSDWSYFRSNFSTNKIVSIGATSVWIKPLCQRVKKQNSYNEEHNNFDSLKLKNKYIDIVVPESKKPSHQLKAGKLLSPVRLREKSLFGS